MQKSQTTRLRSPTSGLSLLEVVVAIAVVSIVLSLLLPAVGRARSASKKVQCLNNVRNIAMALTSFDAANRRLPASGNYWDPPVGAVRIHHNWVISTLAFLEHGNLTVQWDFDKPVDDPVNAPLTRLCIPVLTCPQDISLVGQGDLSYAVNGGFGYTSKTPDGVRDCPTDRSGIPLDLNGDGYACTGNKKRDDLDRAYLKMLGVFFLENWKEGGTTRHHGLADISDGTSQTLLVAENIRVGSLPDDARASFASSNPMRSAFYVGNPCTQGCKPGAVELHLCNSGSARINSGLGNEEGKSPAPSSFHDGGVNVSYADGHAAMLSEAVDGSVYAAIVSPQGQMLSNTPLIQPILSSSF